MIEGGDGDSIGSPASLGRSRASMPLTSKQSMPDDDASSWTFQPRKKLRPEKGLRRSFANSAQPKEAYMPLLIRQLSL
jgi:hypothetical protein